MGLFRRRSSTPPGQRPATRRGAVSVSVSGETNPYAGPRATTLEPVVPPPPAKPVVERYEGTTTEPAATAALRISSAADVDPNVKKYGEDGIFKGGAGGYGGAGTK